MVNTAQPRTGLTWANMQVKPPTTANSVTQFDPAVVRSHAEGTRIVVHSRFPHLVEEFLKHKLAHGSKYEKELYKSFTWQDEVSRLIVKRPLAFVGSGDSTTLRDGTSIRKDAKGEWDRNGTDAQDQNKYLTLSEYLSYDEIMLSSLIGVSGESFFINDGNRFNNAERGKAGTYQESGIIIGLVGARFERRDRMDSIYIEPSVPEPHQDRRLSNIFQSFFGGTKLHDARFDTRMYKARIRITVDILLLEANARAAEQGLQAYTYVVGLGLGVWQVHPRQAELYIEAFTDALHELSLPHISTLGLAWIDVPDGHVRQVTEAALKQDITVIFSKRNPAEKLKTDELLVLSYAWDGNSLPGNEYWCGSLSASGDPAAACMSTIAELHNPIINPDFTMRIEVLGSQSTGKGAAGKEKTTEPTRGRGSKTKSPSKAIVAQQEQITH